MSDFLNYLLNECHYPDAKRLPDGRYLAIYPLAYTHAIILMNDEDRTGYSDRWCYHSYQSCKKFYDEWDGTGEPNGWHRHPSTGRRKDENGKEYVHF